jgi:hypothetical protein
LKQIGFDPGLYQFEYPIKENESFYNVGKIEEMFEHGTHFSFPIDWELLVSDIEELGLYCKKDRNVNSAKKNLEKLFSHERYGENELAEQYLDEAYVELTSQCPIGVLPEFMKMTQEGKYHMCPSPMDLLNVISTVSPKTDPGFPYNQSFKTKEEILYEHFPLVYGLVCFRFLSWHYLSRHCVYPTDYVKCFSADPSFVKEKNEVTKLTKDSRIYYAESVITELCHRLIFGDTTYQLKKYWGLYFSCIGIGFDEYSSNRLYSQLPATLLQTNDVPKFDSSVVLEELIRTSALLSAQMGVSLISPYHDLIYEQTIAGASTVYIFADGDMWAQSVPGKTRTGKFLTSIGNTIVRAARSLAVHKFTEEIRTRVGLSTSPWFGRFAGDDALESHFETNVKYYNLMDFPLRDQEVCEHDQISFCSTFWYRNKLPVGQRIAKAAAHLLFQKDPKIDQVQAFVMNFHNHDCYEIYEKMMSEHRPGIKQLIKQIKYKACIKTMTNKDKKITVNANFIGPLQKGQKRKNKRKRTKRRGNFRKMGSMPQSSNSLNEKVCSQLDAFCPAACGAKVYDTNSSRSLTFQARQTVSIQLDTNGYACYYFTSNPNYISNKATITSNLVASWAGGQGTQFASTLTTTIGKWRVVSWGIHVMSVQSYNNAQGMYIISDVTENAGASTGQDPNSFTNGQGTTVVPVPGAEFFWTGKPLGMPATEYVEAYNTAVYNNYTQCLLTVVGGSTGATPNVALADVCINYEWIPSNVSGGTTYNQLTSAAAPNIPAVMDSRANAAATLPIVVPSKGIIEYGNEVMNKVEGAINLGMRVGGAVATALPMFRGYKMLGSAIRSMAIMNK